MNSTAYRGLVLLVLITCSMLLLWWVADHVRDTSPTPTPSATLSAVTST